MNHCLTIDYRQQQAWIWLSRPERHNAFDAALIAELTTALNDLQQDHNIRLIVLAAQGKSFCAGADLAWMKQAGEQDEASNLADAEKLSLLFKTLHRCKKPVIARVQGAALGGGMGLVAACDIAVCSPEARFALSEVRLGLIPAVISPYVIDAIGPRQTRRYSLTAESMDATCAQRLGLVHELVAAEQLDHCINSLAEQIIKGGPEALCQVKILLQNLEGGPGDDDTLALCASRIASIRSTAEAREGLNAFLQKRPPDWQGV